MRYVIHFGPGRTLADHLQQAGRDAQFAHSIIMYLGKHLVQCEVSIRHVVKKKECIRKLLLCHFTDKDVSLTPMHDCCNRCHILCKCNGDKCAKMPYPFDNLSTVVEEAEQIREVDEEDKNCLRDALREIKQSLNICSRATFFDASGMLCHGFSDTITDSIVNNCHKIFTLSDLMENNFISSLQLAVTVLEVFNELFEDITIDQSLYTLAVEAGAMYSAVMEHVTDCDFESELSNNDD